MGKQSAFANATVKIDWNFGAPAPAIRCPISGEIVLVGYDPATGELADGVEEPKWGDIPTVLFHYLDEVGEFDYINPQLAERINQVRSTLTDEDSEDFHDFDILVSLVDDLGNVPVIFELTTYGFAPGPITSTIWVGLDLAVGLS